MGYSDHFQGNPHQCLSFDEEHWLQVIVSVFSEAQGRFATLIET